MCDRIYLCYNCLWPICFPFGQKMHIGTGWYCWKEHEAGEDESPLDALWPFEFSTDVETLEKLVKQILELYEQWKADDKQEKVFASICQELRKGRTDVVHEFMKSVHRDDEIGNFLRKLTKTKEWQRWSRAARRSTAKAANRGGSIPA